QHHRRGFATVSASAITLRKRIFRMLASHWVPSFMECALSGSYGQSVYQPEGERKRRRACFAHGSREPISPAIFPAATIQSWACCIANRRYYDRRETTLRRPHQARCLAMSEIPGPGKASLQTSWRRINGATDQQSRV